MGELAKKNSFAYFVQVSACVVCRYSFFGVGIICSGLYVFFCNYDVKYYMLNYSALTIKQFNQIESVLLSQLPGLIPVRTSSVFVTKHIPCIPSTYISSSMSRINLN